MIARICKWFADRWAAREAEGYRDGMARIKRYGLDAVHEKFEADFAMGWGHTAHDAGVLRAIRESLENRDEQRRN